MGGNAFGPDAGISRVPGTVYTAYVNDIVRKFYRNGLGLYGVGSFGIAHPDGHSDIDLVASRTAVDNITQGSDEKFENLLRRTFPGTSIVKNGNMTSFIYHTTDDRKHQVDIFVVEADLMDYVKFWRGFKGFTTLLPYLFKSHGFKFTDEGCFVKVTDGDFEDLILVSNSNYIFDTLLGTNILGNGLRTLERGYDILTSSLYFNLEAYGLNEAFEYVGPANRMDYPRYAHFINYLQTTYRDKFARMPHLIPSKEPAHLADDLAKVLEKNAGFQGRKTSILQNYRINRQISSRYNGNVIMEVTGIEPGPKVGLFLQSFREAKSKRNSFMTQVLGWSEGSLREHILNYYNSSDWAETVRAAELMQKHGNLAETVGEVLEVKTKPEQTTVLSNPVNLAPFPPPQAPPIWSSPDFTPSDSRVVSLTAPNGDLSFVYDRPVRNREEYETGLAMEFLPVSFNDLPSLPLPPSLVLPPDYPTPPAPTLAPATTLFSPPPLVIVRQGVEDTDPVEEEPVYAPPQLPIPMAGIPPSGVELYHFVEEGAALPETAVTQPMPELVRIRG
jgi:hypothetical protein